MIYVVRINDKEYEVEVEKGKATINTTTNFTPTAPVQQAQTAAAPVSAPPVAVGEGKPIKSPMPGTILDVKVTPGQTVTKGEVLILLEAMKMENEIIAPDNGVVSQILTQKGASVATNDILIVMN